MLHKTDESWQQYEVVSAEDHEVKSTWKKKTSKSIAQFLPLNRQHVWVTLAEACFTGY